jgi:polyhydroxyalkanoate synthesis regulator phasin
MADDTDTLTTAARAVAEMATAFTAEVDRLKAELRSAYDERDAARLYRPDRDYHMKRANEAEAEAETLRARIRDLEARCTTKEAELADAYRDIQSRIEHIRDLEARPVGGAAEMREAAAKLVDDRAKTLYKHTGLLAELLRLSDKIRALPLPAPSPSTEPDAVPEGHRRVWVRIGGSTDGGTASVWDREPEPLYATVAIVVVDLPIATTVRGTVVGGAR